MLHEEEFRSYVTKYVDKLAALCLYLGNNNCYHEEYYYYVYLFYLATTVKVTKRYFQNRI